MGGKRGKKERKQKPVLRCSFASDEEDHYEIIAQEHEQDEDDEVEEEEGKVDGSGSIDCPSKFILYQQSVQSPKGDISYLQKFFLMYVGGRFPLHLQEDFCGTALLSTEWIRSDARRTAVGVDLDLEALTWCMENNVDKIRDDGFTRISLFHGNVLHPLEAKLVKYGSHDLIKNISLKGPEECSVTLAPESSANVSQGGSVGEELIKKNCQLPARDIVCAFNYSCCCLHRRVDLILYFKHVLHSLSRRGGIFVMDVYGGTSSERELKLQRRFPNFTYVWEQGEFDILHRMTRISLHFHLRNQQKKLRHAFSYNWRLWSLPEIKDCLEEAGFQSVHFWMREMPDIEEMKNSVEFNVGRDMKYEELSSFQQQDAWNAYIVGVVN